MNIITLEYLQPDQLIRVLVALEGCSIQEFSSRIGVSYRTVADTSKGHIPCGHKLTSALAKAYNLDINTLLTIATQYNYNKKAMGYDY